MCSSDLMQGGGQWQPAGTRQQAQSGERRVNVKSGGETDGHQQRHELVGRQLHCLQHKNATARGGTELVFSALGG